MTDRRRRRTLSHPWFTLWCVADRAARETSTCRCDAERKRTLDRTVAVATDAGGGWPTWALAFGRLLDRLADEPTHCVVITQECNERYAQLMVGHRRVRIEASSNEYLSGDFRLSWSDEDLLSTLGFRPPAEALDGFPNNWWIERPYCTGSLVAELVVTTLVAVMAFAGCDPVHVKVFGADHPCASCAWGR
jgi:hypothetical protein